MKRWVLGSAGVVVLVLILLAAVTMLRRDAPRGEIGTERYTDRELAVPGGSFQFPSVEDQLLRPQIRPAVDPAQPLDRERVESLKMDTLEALNRALDTRVENEVEGLLFD